MPPDRTAYDGSARPHFGLDEAGHTPPPQFRQPYHEQQGPYAGWSGTPGRPVAPAPASTNGTAIAALIFAILFAPVGVILGHIARSQIKRTGEGGKGLATAALIIGYLLIVLPLVFWLIASAVVVGVNQHDRSRTVPPPTVTETVTDSP
ncbi:DUF4190 domain-containing protein [Mycobacterium sp. DSM 3803]|nr:DUF4190 domain-containing protein [Mycobacterium sp. DSM 3803]